MFRVGTKAGAWVGLRAGDNPACPIKAMTPWEQWLPSLPRPSSSACFPEHLLWMLLHHEVFLDCQDPSLWTPGASLYPEWVRQTGAEEAGLTGLPGQLWTLKPNRTSLVGIPVGPFTGSWANLINSLTSVLLFEEWGEEHLPYRVSVCWILMNEICRGGVNNQ